MDETTCPLGQRRWDPARSGADPKGPGPTDHLLRKGDSGMAVSAILVHTTPIFRIEYSEAGRPMRPRIALRRSLRG